ncbi:hypothetical protein [Streptomyces sp. BK205]|uniref:hypothetical protein n=1 Tax=Streptomyces sp. BK205 TaxID=2512164 RepID=UPI0010496796|nr:hypothetical protein [Streptomyces sp. BK205]TCR15959.1 hypothetical protein EV578_11571 [Streptomyces sp. BK205]
MSRRQTSIDVLQRFPAGDPSRPGFWVLVIFVTASVIFQRAGVPAVNTVFLLSASCGLALRMLRSSDVPVRVVVARP